MIEILKHSTVHNRYGTRRSIVEWQGSKEQDEIEKYIVNKDYATYGWHMEILSEDKETNTYRGELNEYWD